MKLSPVLHSVPELGRAASNHIGAQKQASHQNKAPNGKAREGVLSNGRLTFLKTVGDGVCCHGSKDDNSELEAGPKRSEHPDGAVPGAFLCVEGDVRGTTSSIGKRWKTSLSRCWALGICCPLPQFQARKLTSPTFLLSLSRGIIRLVV